MVIYTPAYEPFQPTLTRTGLHLSGLEAASAVPVGILSGKVHSFLQIKVSRATQYRIMPDGTQAIFMSQDRCLLGGAHDYAHEIVLTEPGEYFGVRFFPGALRYFFDVDLVEIANSFAGYEYLPHTGFHNLADRLYSLADFPARVKLCEDWLLTQFRPGPPTVLDAALKCMYARQGDMQVSELAGVLGYSSRHLNRHFLQHTGLGLKRLLQILRIQFVYQQRYSGPVGSLQAALDAGYYDQAHFLNSAKKLLPAPQRIFFEQVLSESYNP